MESDIKTRIYDSIKNILEQSIQELSGAKTKEFKVLKWKIWGGRLKPDYENASEQLTKKLEKPIQEYVDLQTANCQKQISELKTQNSDYKSRLENIAKQIPEYLQKNSLPN